MKNLKASLDLKKVMDNLPMAVIVVNNKRLIEHANRIAADYAMKIQEDMIGKPGGERFLRITTIPFKVKMEDFMLVCIEDLTDLKESQKNKLEKAKLDTAIETAGGLCHELNQPLQAALGYTELLLAKYDQIADKNESRLLKLKDQILRISVIVKNLSKISEYRNRDYIGDEKIIDVKKSIA